MKKYIVMLLLLPLSWAAFACLNFYAVNEQGKETIYEDYPPYQVYINPKSDKEQLYQYEKWIAEERGSDRYKYISNYAAYLVKLGRSREALPMLRKLAKQMPGEYEILANLAVAFELNGYPDSALKYMRQSLKLNPDSHNKSEWFHIRILEAAITARDRKLKIDTMNVLKLGNSNSDAIARQIGDQLKERVPLSSSPNILLSKALEESADYYRKVISIDWSVKLYAMAAGYTQDASTRQRIWSKINSAQARIMQLDKSNPKARKEDKVRAELVKKNWQQYVQKDIQHWEQFKAHYEKDLRIVSY
jgi:tetratricopeptide (TPR) repeat protein